MSEVRWKEFFPWKDFIKNLVAAEQFTLVNTEMLRRSNLHDVALLCFYTIRYDGNATRSSKTVKNFSKEDTDGLKSLYKKGKGLVSFNINGMHIWGISS